MRGRTRQALAVIASLVVLFAIGASLLLHGVGEAAGLATIFSSASLVAGLVAWGWHRRSQTTESSPPQQELAQRKLADMVLAQWRDESDALNLEDPRPIPITWESADWRIMDHPVNVGFPGSQIFGQLSGAPDVIRAFRNLPRRRLVVLGDPGTGKTTLAVQVVRELLEHPVPGEPAPVLLTLADFYPDREQFQAWLSRKLIAEYPPLEAAEYGPDAAQSLVAGRRVMPVLDGLDELPASTMMKVIRALNKAAADPLILTCRSLKYSIVVGAPGGDVLTAAAAIKPAPLDGAVISAYIKSCLPPLPPHIVDWQRLMGEVTDDKSRTLAAALASPLALWMLRSAYIDTGSSPAPLLDRTELPAADDVRQHLLRYLVTAVVESHAATGDVRTPTMRRRAWSAANAQRWLAHIALMLSRRQSREFGWRQVPEAFKPRSLALIRFVVTAAVTAVLLTALSAAGRLGVPAGWWPPLFVVVASCSNGIVAGFIFWSCYQPRPDPSARPPGRLHGLLKALFSGGLSMGLPIGIIGGVIAVISIARDGYGPIRNTEFGASIGILGCSTTALGCIMAGGIGWTAARGSSFRRTWLLCGFWIALVGWGLLYAIASLQGRPADISEVEIVLTGFFIAAFAGLLGGLLPAGISWLLSRYVLGMAARRIGWVESPVERELPQSPRSMIRAEMQMLLMRRCIFGLVVALSWTLAVLTAAGGFDWPVLLTVGIIAALAYPGEGYLLAKVWIAARRQLPWQLMDFLDDAHRLGLLRRVGAVYQFRHAELQDELARQAQIGMSGKMNKRRLSANESVSVSPVVRSAD